MCNDVLTLTDSGDSVMLVLLDLTAAFDTIDRNILISPLEHSIGLKGTALKWFKSYLSGKSLESGLPILIHVLLTCSIPPGSILGPIIPLSSSPQRYFKKIPHWVLFLCR